jgi:DNA polymerase-1
LADIGWAGHLFVVRLAGAKDPNALHKQGPASFRERFQAALDAAEAVDLPPPTTPPRRVLLPYQPFPVGALPGVVGPFVLQGAAALGCDVAFLALPALTVIASAIGNCRCVRLKRDWFEPCVIWSGIVGDSGTLKSPAGRLVTEPLFRLQRQRIAEYQARLKDYEAALADFQKSRRKEEAGAGAPPEKPVCTRYLCSDVTVERLAGILAENPRGVLVFRDELGGLLQGFNQYKPRGGSDLAAWLQMHRAEPLVVDRKTGERPLVFVPRAAVSITGGIQPLALARALTPDYLDAGLAARLLLAMPPKKAKVWNEAEVDPLVKEEFEKLLGKLIDLEPDLGQDGEPVPFAVKLSPEAKAAWVEFYNGWAKEQAAAEGDLAACFSKLEAYAGRFALIHHVVTNVGRNADCDPIEAVSVEAGVVLARWFANEARRVYGMLAESAEERRIRRLVEFIQGRGGAITIRQLHRANQAKYRSAEEAAEALQELVDMGLADWEDKPPTKRGGRATRLLRLRPPVTDDETDTTPDGDEDEGGGSAEVTEPGPDDGTGGGTATAGDPNTAGDVCRVRATGASATTGCVDPQEDPTAEHLAGDGDGSGVESVLSSVTGATEAASSPTDGPAGAANGFCHVDGVVSPRAPAPTPPPTYRMVHHDSELATVLQALGESALVGVDCETTGLDPRRDRIRLLQLATDRGVFILDLFQVDARPLFELLAGRTLVLHNAAFDLAFLAQLGFEPGAVKDTLLLSRLLHGTRQPRGFHALAACAERELGRPMDKAEQRSDWSGELTAEQLEYAAADVAVLPALLKALEKQGAAAGLEQTAALEHGCIPAMVWLARSGVAFDRPAWEALARGAEAEAADLRNRLDALAPPCPGEPAGTGRWNWNSPRQVLRAFAAAGHKLDRTDDATLAACPHPLAELLRRYRAASKRAWTYGLEWLKHVAEDGRVYAAWQQLGADSGRMACSKPNLQNLPTLEAYRRCFLAPPGRVLVKADYSQIELRIAAKVSGDAALLEAYRAGADLHTRTAQRVLGVEEVSKHQRKLAKALGFGLLYGMGVRGFRLYAKSQYGLDMTEAEAGRYRRAFFDAYPGLARWHAQVKRQHALETRTLTGRRRRLTPKDSDTLRLNTPVQGSGADGLKQALALLWQRRHQCPGAFLVLVVHDEIVVEADAGQAEAAAAWLRQAMLDGMQPLLDPVPVAVDVTIAPTWGGN